MRVLVLFIQLHFTFLACAKEKITLLQFGVSFLYFMQNKTELVCSANRDNEYRKWLGAIWSYVEVCSQMEHAVRNELSHTVQLV